VESLRQQLSNYDKDKMTLQLTKQRLLHADKQLKNLEWEKEVLSQRFTKIEAERNELFTKFESSVQEVQQKTGLKKMLLEKKVEALNQALEKKQTQLAEVLVAANMDSGTLQNVWPHHLMPSLNICNIYMPV
jgi:growth arrest-specific protein 8